MAPWYASFGGFVLCSTSPDTDIVLEGTRVKDAVTPLSVSTAIRQVTTADLKQASSATTRDAYAPFITSAGSRSDFDESYVSYSIGGRFN